MEMLKTRADAERVYAEKVVAAAEANLARLNELLGYQTVRAPFAGVITLRNVDSGVLVNEGVTLLFRIAQTDRLRTYLNVPQADAEGRERTILFNLSGHGHFDLGAYDAYLSGKLEDFELPEAEIARALQAIEGLPKPAGVAV